MLKKLFKYDFLAVTKTMWLFTAIVILITAASCGISQLVRYLDMQTIPDAAGIMIVMMAMIAVIVSVYAIIAYYVLALIMVLVRYYKNLFTDEGYLTFTLPVRITDILNSKILSGVLWIGIATIVELGCFFVFLLFWVYGGNLAPFGTDMDMSFFIGGFDSVIFDYGMEPWESLLCSAFDGIVTLVFSVLLLYLSVTFASVVAKRARVILGIVFYFGITLALSLVMMLIIVIFGAIFNGGDTPILADAEFAYLRYALRYIFYGGAAAGAYFLNRYLLKNRLNLL